MKLPISSDNLISAPIRRNLVPKTVNIFKGTHETSKNEDKQKLDKMINLKENEKLTMEKYVENNKLMKQFNEKWKPKKKEQTLQEALFDVYLERNLKGDED